MSDNMNLYNAVRTPPPEALREIKAGRLAGKSDINPMWRIKALTEQFGPCGEGWKYTIERLWTEQGANGEIAAFALINLYYRIEGQWSDPVPGIGGNSFVAKEKSGLYTSDECYKMALTDALSVACKALGVAADVAWLLFPIIRKEFITINGSVAYFITLVWGKKVTKILIGLRTRLWPLVAKMALMSICLRL